MEATQAEALAPDTFTRLTAVATHTEVISNPLVVTGLTGDTLASLSGVGELLVNGVAVGTQATVRNGDSVAIKTTSSVAAGMTQQLTLSYGGQQYPWQLTTAMVTAPTPVAGTQSGYTPVNCEVNEAGGAICSLPITVSAGTGGMASQLSLNYSSQSVVC